MAVCKRCGTSFNYEQRDGVCPKCCFYNRPPGSRQEDDSWVKNYNYEDNSYDVMFSVNEENWQPSAGHEGHKEVDGSHIHLDDGRVVRGKGASTGRAGRKPSGKGRALRIFIIIVILYYVSGLLGSLLSYFM